MQIIRRPVQHTFLASLVLLSVPIFILNIWVMQKGPVAKLFQHEKLWWIGTQSAFALLALYWLLKVKWRGFYVVLFMSAAAIAGNIYFLISTKNYALAFYALFLVILSALYFLHLFKSLGEPYYRSGQRWYEGRPRFLPNITVEATLNQSSISGRVSRLETEGCYVFFQNVSENGQDVDKLNDITIQLHGLRLSCAVEAVSKNSDGTGRGFRFTAISADQQKDIRDFIDRLRSSGYVA